MNLFTIIASKELDSLSHGELKEAEEEARKLSLTIATLADYLHCRRVEKEQALKGNFDAAKMYGNLALKYFQQLPVEPSLVKYLQLILTRYESLGELAELNGEHRAAEDSVKACDILNKAINEASSRITNADF